MTNGVLIALFTKLIDQKLKELPEAERGPRGQRGPRGLNGSNGRDFDFQEHAPTIKSWVEEFKLKFEDLTDEEIESLKGRAGKDGRDGKSFIFEENQAAIDELVRGYVDSLSESFKLKFGDLSDEEQESLRGRAGRDGRDGKNFVFEEHEEYFKSLKMKFSDLTAEERASLVLRFTQLTDAEKDSLKLRFSDLTDEERISLKGARGSRGQRGQSGHDGAVGAPGLSVRGLPGPIGMRGLSGVNGRDGEDGLDGQDAPVVVDVRIEQHDDEFNFIFVFSDATELKTNRVKIPASNAGRYFFGMVGGSSGGGEGGGGTGADGKSAYEIAVENGFVGTEVDWLASLVGPEGPQGEQGEQGEQGPQGPPGSGGGGTSDGPIPSGPFSVNAGETKNLGGEIYDSTEQTEIDFVARIRRGTGVYARVEFSIFFRDGAWEFVYGNGRYSELADAVGVDFSVNPTSGQVIATVGLGDNAVINLLKTYWDVVVVTPVISITVADGATEDLVGEIIDSDSTSEVDYVFSVHREPTGYVREEVSFFYRDGAWEQVDGGRRYHEDSVSSGMTYAIDPVTEQVSATNIGVGDVEIAWRKTEWDA